MQKPLLLSIKRISFSQFIGYLWVGGFAAIIDFGLLFSLVKIDVNYLVANTIAFLSANIFNFLAGHYIVFNKRSRLKNFLNTYLAVLGISVGGLIINDFTLFVSVEILSSPLILGKVFATIIAFLWNFGARKKWIYV